MLPSNYYWGWPLLGHSNREISYSDTYSVSCCIVGMQLICLSIVALVRCHFRSTIKKMLYLQQGAFILEC
jgi:hypothetical protein